MIIKTLVENTSISKDFGCEHGLSLYIETENHKILFDVGASGLFLENSKKLSVDIADVDLVVISHGHYDHGGGLKEFLRENTKAEIFIHQQAFAKHYSLRLSGNLEFIGLDEELKPNRQIIFTSDRFFISKGIQVFSNITQKEPGPISNSSLFMEQNGQIIKDIFAHEQNLIIEEAGKTLLVTGCAHNGIVNILEHFYTLKRRMPDYVIGGFHLSGGSSCMKENLETVDKIGQYLLNTRAKYYTGHCTGIDPYNRLKDVMGESIDYLPAGSTVIIE